MSSSAVKDITVILMLGFAAAAFFALFCNPLSGFDPAQYDRLGYNLASGHGFSMSEGEPYLPTMFREPMYPFFLAAIFKVLGHNIRFIVLIQIALHALTALIAYKIAGLAFSRSVAFLSGALVAVFPTLANFSSYVMSETFFTFLLCAAVYIFLKAMNRERLPLFAASGVLFGALILTKLTSLFLPFFLSAVAILALKGGSMKKLWLGVILMLLISSLMVSAWGFRNKQVFNTSSLALRGGDVMWSRAQKVDDTPREVLATAVCSISEYAGGKLFPDLVMTPDRYLYKDLDRAVELQNKYKEEGRSTQDIDETLKREAIGKISSHPVKYVAYTFIEAIKMTAFTYLPFFNEDAVRVYFRNIQNGGLIFAALKGTMRVIAYPLLFLCIVGVVKNFTIWNRWAVIITVILYFNITYSLMDTIGRYGVPLIPFYCIFAAAAFFSAGREAA